MNLPHSGINVWRVGVDRAKDGLQIHGDKGVTCALQTLQPGVPKTSVAKKSMNENHTAFALGDAASRNVVGYRF
jgi:uncharacterized protein YmfQ (DUF2313 family)